MVESNYAALTAAANGFVLVLVMGGNALAEPLYGFLLSWGGSKTIIDKVVVYSSQNYFHATLILPVAFAIACIAAWLLRETKAQLLAHRLE